MGDNSTTVNQTQNSKTISCRNWSLCFSTKKLKIMRKIRPVACNDYNSQTVSHGNWIFCLLVCDFQQLRNPKIMRKIRPVACKDYNSQTVSHRNWILCSLLFQCEKCPKSYDSSNTTTFINNFLFVLNICTFSLLYILFHHK